MKAVCHQIPKNQQSDFNQYVFYRYLSFHFYIPFIFPRISRTTPKIVTGFSRTSSLVNIIGSYFELSDTRAIESLYLISRLHVAWSPLIAAMTYSPDSASSCFSTMTTSPSYILGSIESPRIRSAKYFFPPRSQSLGISSQSTISSISSIGIPAAT